MNLKIVLRSLGMLLVCECITLVIPLITALIYQDGDFSAFLMTMVALLLVAIPLMFIKPKDKNIYPKEGFTIVALGWLLISFFGAFPFYLSGAIPSFVDAFFESSSGFTTTGSTILNEIQSLPHGILLWRSFTHWVGGMGILVLTIAILPSMGMGSMQVMKAESPGPIVGKIVPRLGASAKILYSIYLGLTVILTILLMLAGMNFYDALLHAFGTLGTGGFSNKNLSVAAFDSALIDGIITTFMILSGINFSLYYFVLKGNFKNFWKDQELRLYLFILSSATLMIMANLLITGYYSSAGTAFRYTSFQVASVMTTTGYATADFNLWPMFSKIILLTIMFVGGCAGSTGGGIKVIRFFIAFKSIMCSFKRIIHPNACCVVRLNGKKIDNQTVQGVMSYFFVYILVFAAGILIISLNNFDAATTVSSVIGTLNNIGPGIEMVGPMGNFSQFNDLSKMTFSLLMITGRVELYPLLLLLIPELWKKN